MVSIGRSRRRGIMNPPALKYTRKSRASEASVRKQGVKLLEAHRITEAQLSSYIKGLLETDGWHVFRMEPISRREWAKGTGELGQPDLLAIRYAEYADRSPVWASQAQVIWCEVKRLDRFSKKENCWLSTKAAAHQRSWHTLERKRGSLVIVAGEDFEATPEGALQWYRNSGFMRKDIR